MLKIKYDGSTMDYNLVNDISGLFDYLQKGDSVVKNNGTYDVIVKRNNQSKNFFLDYGCENK
jgi:hypothetical protein